MAARAGRRLQSRRRTPRQGRTPARQAQAEKHFALRIRSRHHHGRPRHGVAPFARSSRAPCDPAPPAQLAVLRRPPVHARLPLPARMAGCAEGRLARAHDVAFSRRHAEKGLRPASHLGAPARLVEWLDGALTLRLRRRQGDGQGRAADADARLRRREGPDAEAAGRRSQPSNASGRYSQDVYCGRRAFPQRAHQGATTICVAPLPKACARTSRARSSRTTSAGQVPRHVPAGSTATCARAYAQEAGEGLLRSCCGCACRAA